MLREIDLAVSKYNFYTGNKILINTNFLKNVINVNSLPSTIEIINNFETEKLNDFWQLFNKFEFIDETWEPSKMAAAIVIASYRTWMLVNHPDWKTRGAQIASTLEELLAIEAINGNSTAFGLERIGNF